MTLMVQDETKDDEWLVVIVARAVKFSTDTDSFYGFASW